MNTEDIPQGLIDGIAIERAVLHELLLSKKALTDEQKATKTRHHRDEITLLTDAIKKQRSKLAGLARECQKYEATQTAWSNVAGDPKKLRMPTTKSGCYNHAAGFERTDDT